MVVPGLAGLLFTITLRLSCFTLHPHPCTLQVLMTVDTYATCPCGSGKKIKFCKCRESVGELDRVLKMVEGGQVVPALDRLSSVLQEHPDAAWALAIRGRLLLDLREYESLSENAERFIRLQPSNPLALTQRAAAQLFRGEVEEAVASMLEALTESGQEVDHFVLDVASVLAYALAQGGVFLTARTYASLAMTAQGYEGGQTAVEVLRQLNSSATVNQLLKSIPDLIPRPADVDWGERYDEALRLLHSTKVVLAQTKLESLQRVAPGEPAVLSGLLSCAIWRGDVDAQADCLKKLSACESLEIEQRVRYRAMAALVPPGSPELSVEVLELNADIEDAEQVEMAMTADSRFVTLPREMFAELKAGENDVPPRAGFQIIDRDPPETDQLPEADAMPEALAIVFLFGKQTDRSARVEVHDVRRRDLEQVRARVQPTLGGAELTEQVGESLPLVVAANPPLPMIRFQGSRAEAQRLQGEVTDSRMPNNIASLPLPLLGGVSLAEAAEDEGKRFERTATMRAIENYDAIVSRGKTLLEDLYRLANLEPPPEIKLSVQQVETVDNEDLNRVDPSGLDAESLLYLLRRAQQVSASIAVRRVAEALLEAELTEEQKPAPVVAYMSLVGVSNSAEESIMWLEKAKAYAEANGLPTARLLLAEVNLRLQTGDGPGFQSAIESISAKYGNDPEVMVQVQQLLMAYGLIRPDGTPQMAPPTGPGEPGAMGVPGAAPAAPAPGAGSGLWTPDQPTSPPPPTSPPSSGGGKLWVPGMD